jgi:hypothetical protein
MRITIYLLGILVAAGMAGVASANDSGLATHGHPTLEAINEAYLSGDISEAEALLYRFYFCKAPAKLPGQFELVEHELKCATPILLEVYERMGDLPAAMVAEIVQARSRPYNLPLTHTTEHFIIHYTLTGYDAVPNEQYVDVVDLACEDSYDKYFVDMTWDAPPGDGGLGGGTNMIDCYIHNMQAGILGMAEWENPVPGDPPYDYTGFFHIDNSINSSGVRGVVVAHEFMHVTQFGYYATGAGSVSWYMENCAMIGEEWVYDAVNDYEGYLQSFLGFPYKSLKHFNGQYEYGGIVWPMYKSERFYLEIVEEVWDGVRWVGALGIWDVFEGLFAPFGYDMNSAYTEFMRWCFYTRDRDDGQHFDEAGEWNAFMFADQTFDEYPTGEQHPREFMRPEALGTSLMQFQPDPASTDNILQVTMDGPVDHMSACDFIRKEAGVDLWMEYYMTYDQASGDGVIEIPNFDTAEYVYMFTSAAYAPGPPRDYAFWGDDIEGAGDVSDDLNIGELVRIFPFRPNPFMTMTSVSYTLANGSAVAVRILDANGRVVRGLFAGDQHAGNYEVMWDGIDNTGTRVASGTYYALVSVNGQEQARQVTLLK